MREVACREVLRVVIPPVDCPVDEVGDRLIVVLTYHVGLRGTSIPKGREQV